MFRVTFLLGLWILIASRLIAVPQWTTNPAVLGSVDDKQALVRAYPLGPTVSAPEFSLSLQLVNSTESLKMKRSERDERMAYLRKQAHIPGLPVAPKVKLQPGESDPADEQVAVWRSQWSIPQLTSFIYPANRDRFIWNPPGGGQIIFAREDIEGTFPKFTPEGWACAEVAPGIYRIFDREGWSWRYENGLPATLTAPSGRYLEFTHDKGLLTRIVQRLSLTDKATQQIVLQVKYDAQRRPLQIDSGPIEHRFTYDDKTGHLLAWHSTAFKLGEAPDAKVKPDEIRPESNPAIAIAPGDERQNADTGAVMGATRFAYLNDVLVAVQFPGGKVERFTWDYAKGQLLADGTYRYISDAKDGTTAIDPEGRKNSIRFNASRDQLERTAPDGSTTSETYQRKSAGRGLMRSRKGAGGEVLVQVDYTPRHLIAVVRELGKPEIRNVYDNRDRLIEVWRAPIVALDADAPAVQRQGQLWQRYTYDGASRQPATITDALGQVARFEYDERGQLIGTLSPGGAHHHYSYDSWGRLIRHELPNGALEFTKYDQWGRVTESRAVDGTSSTFAYDSQGRSASRTERNVSYANRYDDKGRLFEVQRANKPWLRWRYASEVLTLNQPAKLLPGWPREVTSVDASVVAFVDARGCETKRYFDADGHLMEAVNPAGEHTSYRYNKVGEVMAWVDARANGLVFERDVMGRLTKQVNALGQTLSWRFDSAGRLASRDNGVQTASYHYDPAGRLIQIDYGKGQVVNYDRDDFGRMTSASTGEVTTIYRYDALDRVVQTEQRPTGGTSSGMAYVYSVDGTKATSTLLGVDSAGRLVPKSATHTTYDILGRPLVIELDGTMTATNTYDPRTLKLANKHLGNGLAYSYSYDDQGQLEKLEVLNREGVLRESLSYDWDDNGLLNRRVLQTPAKAPKTGLEEVELHYDYDKLGRLASVTSPQDPKQNRSYRYDGAGNLVENRSADRWIKMEYDDANQLVTKNEAEDGEKTVPETTRFAYDVAGRMVSEMQGGRMERNFTYGYLDKVLSVDRPGNHHADYVYDASGMLVRKGMTEPAAVGASERSAPKSWETWVWDGLALVQRGGEVFVNEAHPAGGQAIMSRTLDAEP